MVFTTEGLFAVDIESWPEWDLDPQPMNCVQTLDQPKYFFIYWFIMISLKPYWIFSKEVDVSNILSI